MREHVVAAATAMRTGDWQACRDYMLDVKVGLCYRVVTELVLTDCLKVWNLFLNPEKTKEMLTRQEYHTYMFRFAVYSYLIFL